MPPRHNTTSFFSSNKPTSKPRHRSFNRPSENQIPTLASSLPPSKPSESTLSKLQSFAFKPTVPRRQSSHDEMSEVEHPATPMPQKIPLSDLMSNTPKRQETETDGSPEDKVIWKLSPKNVVEVPAASQEEGQNDKMTSFLNLLKDDGNGKKMASPNMNTKSRQMVRRIQQENSSPSTPSIRQFRPLPGPSPLSLKRSASFENTPAPERPRKRRTCSSDIIFQKRVSSLLEQAQSMYQSDDESSSQAEPASELSSDMEQMNDMEDFVFDGDLDLFEAELQFDPLSSDGLSKMDLDAKIEVSVTKLDLGDVEVSNESKSDDLFDVDFDNFKPEELEELDTHSMPLKEANADEDALFGDGYDDLMDIEFEETQPEVHPTSRRFKVISMKTTSHAFEGKDRFQRTLVVQEYNTNDLCTVHLRDDWIRTPVEVNDVINIIGIFNANGACVLDNISGLLILHPDNLVSSTHVADSFKCLRRAVLQDQVKATSETSKPLVYGSIIHELFQQALSLMDFSTSHLDGIIDTLVIRHIEQLYSINITPAQATADLREKIYLLQGWAEVFCVPRPSVFSFMADHCGSSDAKPKVCINKVLDIEEHVWSPTYGLKGNIDATVQVCVEEPDAPTRTLIVPLEVKTGKNTSLMNHRAQTMLYTLMLSDRYDVDVKYGILYYVDAKESIRVRALRNEVRGLIMGRNELAKWIKQRDGLPEMLKSERDCKNCYAAGSCLVYHKTLENGTQETSGLGEYFDEQTTHLDYKDAAFLKHWNDLLTKEEAEIFRFRNELWTMLSADREKLGRCFGNLIIDPEETSVDGDGEKINRFKYRLRRGESSISTISSQPRNSFLNSQISIGDPIVVSDELGHFALANGFVTDLQPNVLYVSVDRRLHGARTRESAFDPVDNQVFTGIVDISRDGVPRTTSQLSTQVATGMTYRVDKDEFKSGIAMARNNVIQLFTKNGDAKRRELIIRGREPIFKTHQGTQYSYFDKHQESLNVDQRKAVEKVLTAEDYALVLGMPGTGKTTTIAHIIRALVKNGKSILLTSYTHTAVDNILLKLKNDGIKMLRLGSIAKVHPEVREFAIGGNIQTKSFDELHEIYTSPLVVATTCLGINHFIFNKRKFDYCIVDEASQLTLPVCLGPLRYADRFVLVGDHFQLSPLVRSVEAQKGGLDVSLFKLLTEAHPSALTVLEYQYRMNADIMLLSNSLVYDGMLKCGNEIVANRVLQIPNRKLLDATKPWIKDVLSERYNVVFCDTDRLPALESKRGNRTTNEIEAKLIKQIVDTLRDGGVPASSIGVMSVYRSQLKLLSHLLTPNHPDIEIHTADRFQGRDKEIVIVSLVRSNPENYIGELLQDWRRVNVAFTRAKSKLIIFGSKTTIRETNPLDEFVKLIEAKGWVYTMPHEAFPHEVTPKLRRKETSPRKLIVGKEMLPPRREGVKGGNVMKVTGATVLKGRAVLRDIVNEHR